MKTLSTPKSPLVGMGVGQKIATIALAALTLIALLAVLTGRGGGGSTSPSSKFTPATYSDGASNSSTAASSRGSSAGASSGDGSDTGNGLGAVTLAHLPAQARTTLERIDAGGPFPYSRDGVVFSNREGLLPKHPRGWYHEYTVTTPGESDRGARRLIQGRDGTIYYTGDHYKSFRRVTR